MVFELYEVQTKQPKRFSVRQWSTLPEPPSVGEMVILQDNKKNSKRHRVFIVKGVVKGYYEDFKMDWEPNRKFDTGFIFRYLVDELEGDAIPAWVKTKDKKVPDYMTIKDADAP